MSCLLLQTQLHRLFPCLNRSRTHLVAVCPVQNLFTHRSGTSREGTALMSRQELLAPY